MDEGYNTSEGNVVITKHKQTSWILPLTLIPACAPHPRWAAVLALLASNTDNSPILPLSHHHSPPLGCLCVLVCALGACRMGHTTVWFNHRALGRTKALGLPEGSRRGRQFCGENSEYFNICT